MDIHLSKPWEIAKDREAWHATVRGVTKPQTWLSSWTTSCLLDTGQGHTEGNAQPLLLRAPSGDCSSRWEPGVLLTPLPWVAVSFNFKTAVTIHSNFGAEESKICHCFHLFPTYLPWSDGTRCHDLSFLNVEFQTSFFTLFFHPHQEVLRSIYMLKWLFWLQLRMQGL